MSQQTPQQEAFLNTALEVSIALSILAPVLTATMDWYLDLGLHPEAGILAILFVAL
jgi:hypothetical protein